MPDNPILPGPGFLSNTALLLWFTNLTPDSTLIRTLIPPCHCFGIITLIAFGFLYVLHHLPHSSWYSLRPQACTLSVAKIRIAFACIRSNLGFPSIQGTFPISLLCTYLFIGQYHLYNIAHHIKTYYVAMYKSPRAYAIIHSRICPFSPCCRLATSDMCGCSYFG